MIKVAVFDTKPYDKASFLAAAEGQDDLHMTFFETKLDADTVGLADGFDCVVIFVNDTADKAVIDHLYAHGVCLIALRCAGFNQVDVKAAFEKIHVVRVPAYSPYAIAEHAMAMLLTSVRRIHKAYNRTREYNFSITGLCGFDLHGKTVGVVGAGKIGRAFINICNGFGMRVLAYDKYPDHAVQAEFVEPDELFRESDIISLHCPLTEENYHMIDARAISLMKKGVVLVNTSRGGLIDAEALLEGIKMRKVGAVCLDVYEEESDLFFEDRSGHILGDDVLARLLSMPNVILTAHQAFLTEEALGNIAQATLANIRSFFAGEEPENEICYHCGKIGECRKLRQEKCF